jgi:hypothetical protein
MYGLRSRIVEEEGLEGERIGLDESMLALQGVGTSVDRSSEEGQKNANNPRPDFDEEDDNSPAEEEMVSSRNDHQGSDRPEGERHGPTRQKSGNGMLAEETTSTLPSAAICRTEPLPHDRGSEKCKQTGDQVIEPKQTLHTSNTAENTTLISILAAIQQMSNQFDEKFARTEQQLTLLNKKFDEKMKRSIDKTQNLEEETQELIPTNKQVLDEESNNNLPTQPQSLEKKLGNTENNQERRESNAKEQVENRGEKYLDDNRRTGEEVLQLEPKTSLEDAKKMSISSRPDKNPDDPERTSKTWKTMENDESRVKYRTIIEEAHDKNNFMTSENRKRPKKKEDDGPVVREYQLAYRNDVGVKRIEPRTDKEHRRRELKIRGAEKQTEEPIKKIPKSEAVARKKMRDNKLKTSQNYQRNDQGMDQQGWNRKGERKGDQEDNMSNKETQDFFTKTAPPNQDRNLYSMRNNRLNEC